MMNQRILMCINPGWAGGWAVLTHQGCVRAEQSPQDVKGIWECVRSQYELAHGGFGLPLEVYITRHSDECAIGIYANAASWHTAVVACGIEPLFVDKPDGDIDEATKLFPDEEPDPFTAAPLLMLNEYRGV